MSLIIEEKYNRWSKWFHINQYKYRSIPAEKKRLIQYCKDNPGELESFGQETPHTTEQWENTQISRRRYAHSKRAAKDKKFRRKFFSKINKEKRKLHWQPTTAEEVIKWHDTYKERLDKLSKLCDMLREADYKKEYVGFYTSELTSPNVFLIQPGDNFITADDLRADGLKLGTHRTWHVTAGYTTKIIRDDDNESCSLGRNGWFTTQRSDHRATVQSFGVLRDPNYLEFVWMGKIIPMPAPYGFEWILPTDTRTRVLWLEKDGVMSGASTAKILLQPNYLLGLTEDINRTLEDRKIAAEKEIGIKGPEFNCRGVKIGKRLIRKIGAPNEMALAWEYEQGGEH